MKPPPAVVDTNVVVSALLASDADAPPCRILDAMLGGAFRYLLSIDLLAEYRQVLLRPRIRRSHGLTESEVDRVLTEIASGGIFREPTASPEAPPDPGDQHLFDLLAAAGGGVLVTGDRRLLESPPTFASVVSPRSFLEILSM